MIKQVMIEEFKHYMVNNKEIDAEYVFCSGCEETECDALNPIYFCDGCDIAVHQECYGVGIVEEEEWYCNACKRMSEQRIELKCVYCPEIHMALQEVYIDDQIEWAHLSCLKWHQGLDKIFYAQNAYITIQQVEQQQQQCGFCKQDNGYVTQCGYVGCQQYFHIGCAKVKGMLIHQEGMEVLYQFIRPHLKQPDKPKQLFCYSHCHDQLNSLDSHYANIYQDKFINVALYRIQNYYQFNSLEALSNHNNKKKSSKDNNNHNHKQQQQTIITTTTKQQSIKSQLRPKQTHFYEQYQEQQYKDLRLTNKQRKLNKEFTTYMKDRLSAKLHQLQLEFYKLNTPLHDSFISIIDVQVSLKLFSKVVDIHNLPAFDKYLVYYFLLHNIVADPSNPVVAIKDNSDLALFWKAQLQKMGLQNGTPFSTFLNQLRVTVLRVLSRKNEEKRKAFELFEYLGGCDKPDVILIQ